MPTVVYGKVRLELSGPARYSEGRYRAALANRHPYMKRSPFVAVLLSGALAFQLLLAGGGVMCVGGGAEASHASAASPAPEDHVPCDQPPSAPRTCQTMAPCAPGFVFVALPPVDADVQGGPHIVAAATPMPASRTVPPEPPPPRA